MAIVIPPFDLEREHVLKIDDTLKEAIRELITGVVNDPAVAVVGVQWWPTDANVVARWLMDLNARDWPAALRALGGGADGESLNGFLITRRRRRPVLRQGQDVAQGLMSGEKTLAFEYAIYYFGDYDTGDNTVNTESQMNRMFEALDEGFDYNPTLGFDAPVLVGENPVLEVKGIGAGWTVDNIDVVGGRYRMAQSHLTVYLAKLIRSNPQF
jgi:hypothetical protein